MKIDANQMLLFTGHDDHISCAYDDVTDISYIIEICEDNTIASKVYLLTPDEGTMRDVTEDVAIAWLEYMSKDTDIETFIGYARPYFVERFQDGWMEDYSELNGIDWRDY